MQMIPGFRRALGAKDLLQSGRRIRHVKSGVFQQPSISCRQPLLICFCTRTINAVIAGSHIPRSMAASVRRAIQRWVPITTVNPYSMSRSTASPGLYQSGYALNRPAAPPYAAHINPAVARGIIKRAEDPICVFDTDHRGAGITPCRA